MTLFVRGSTMRGASVVTARRRSKDAKHVLPPPPPCLSPRMRPSISLNIVVATPGGAARAPRTPLPVPPPLPGTIWHVNTASDRARSKDGDSPAVPPAPPTPVNRAIKSLAFESWPSSKLMRQVICVPFELPAGSNLCAECAADTWPCSSYVSKCAPRARTKSSCMILCCDSRAKGPPCLRTTDPERQKLCAGLNTAAGYLDAIVLLPQRRARQVVRVHDSVVRSASIDGQLARDSLPPR